MIAECDGLFQRGGKRPSWVYRGEVGGSPSETVALLTCMLLGLFPIKSSSRYIMPSIKAITMIPRRVGDAAGLLEGLTLR